MLKYGICFTEARGTTHLREVYALEEEKLGS